MSIPRTCSSPRHTGVRVSRNIQRSRVAYRRRKYERNLRQLNRLSWPNAVWQCRSRSVDLRTTGRVGRDGFKPIDRYPGSSSCSVQSAVDDEDFTGNLTWVTSRNNRAQSATLSPFVYAEGWRRRLLHFTYKRVWYAGQSFGQGLFNFSFLPFPYELIRLIVRDCLYYKHLFAPVWLVGEVYGFLRQAPNCTCRSFPRAGASQPNSYSFIQLRSVILSSTDAHAESFLSWLMRGRGYGVAKHSWAPDARTGRFVWQPDGATYWSGASVSSFTTGGMAEEFDRLIVLMLDHGKFHPHYVECV